jgi:signal transduction histidine kinase
LRCDRLAEEQTTALSLLFEQFAVTLHNRQLDAQRLRAERRALQQEKLSVLGLMAGSLAHELRNPLSSIRTIAALMLEDCEDGQKPGENSSHRHDIAMIVSEIDRLTETTQRLLDYARPPDAKRGSACPDQVILRLLNILGHFARQQNVKLDPALNAPQAFVAASDASLSEIMFNLVRNAIEAAGQSPVGRVAIQSSIVEDWVIVTISDNGPGVDPALRKSLFQPFVTGKAGGTGLGLYVAFERVQESGGTIRCESEVGRGTVFEVKLPIHREELH